MKSQLATQQLVPGNPSQATPAERAAARSLLRQSHATVYGQLTQTMNLPPNCAVIKSIEAVSNDALVLQAIAEDFDPGEMFSASFSDIEGTSHLASWSWEVENGQNRLVFRSPYNDRFIFHVSCRDAQGTPHSFDLICPGSTTETGAAVAEDDCTRPYHGHPRIFVSGISMDRFTAGGTHEDDLRKLFTDAIAGMGGVPRVEVSGSTPITASGGPEFYYAEISAQKMDICRGELMARLQTIATQLGATLVRDGNIIWLKGPDANGLQPNRFRGPWSER